MIYHLLNFTGGSASWIQKLHLKFVSKCNLICMLQNEVKITPPCMFPLVPLFARPSFKNLYVLYWPSGQGCQKCVYIFKVTFRGIAEIQNGWIMNFSSATRDLFSNIGLLLASLLTWSKNTYRLPISGNVMGNVQGKPSILSMFISLKILKHCIIKFDYSRSLSRDLRRY